MKRSAQRLRVQQIGFNRRDDDAGFEGDEIDAHQRYANPRVDDDASVQNSIEHIDETLAFPVLFKWHALVPAIPCSWVDQ